MTFTFAHSEPARSKQYRLFVIYQDYSNSEEKFGAEEIHTYN